MPLRQVVGGYCHTLALTAGGAVLSLGCGEDGQRGDLRPVDGDDDDDDADDDADGSGGGCRVGDSDSVAFTPATITEATLPGGGVAGGIAAGANHSLAVAADGTQLWGWGSNEHGQLGPGISAQKISAATPIALGRPGVR
eukprot:SAG11_NODE_6347_length_1331_cov_1.583604_1_plen_139_part_10